MRSDALVRTEIARQTLMLRPNPETRIEAAADQGQVAAVRRQRAANRSAKSNSN